MSKKTNNCSGTITLRGAPQSYTRIRQDNLPNLSVYLRDPSVYLRVTPKLATPRILPISPCISVTPPCISV